jgi:hypothetical protein
VHVPTNVYDQGIVCQWRVWDSALLPCTSCCTAYTKQH